MKDNLMIKNLFLVVTFVGIPLCPFNALALEADSTFTVTFTYTKPVCELSTGSDAINVSMGTHEVSALSGKGKETSPSPLDIVLECPDNTSGVQVTFSGTPDVNDKSLLALTGAGEEGTAGGIGIALYDPDGNALALNSPTSTLPLSEGENQLNFTARYKSTQDNVTAGNANATATFSLAYP
ncbi:fimbrial protein [Lelliottia wanjuensis]|uniref:fimbrial protein n=1 Tax=Lelliottia wanjuensis TaxID=3050585 RepID=UPI00254F2042|nr:fimbrial protein [Lelliottia sp. V104_15]MDK9605799.1 fimbrial protein [Lelliottia sp. V104_15]